MWLKPKNFDDLLEGDQKVIFCSKWNHIVAGTDDTDFEGFS